MDTTNPDVNVLITAEAISKSFNPGKSLGGVTVLRGISLRVCPGEMVAIVGPSGSGKSTLLYCLAGLESVTSGRVDLFGNDLSGLSRNQLARLRRDQVGFVFQSYNLIPSLTAEENAGLPRRLARRRGVARATRDSLRAVGLSERSRFLPGKLSGGQQQRVAIARVLASGASIVFADEPTGALDTHAGAEVLSLLRSTATGSRSVVLVTHDLEAAARADRVLVLRDGLIHAELTAPSAEDVLAAMRAAASEVEAA